ncbi:MAG: hypothetical protein Kow0025_26190 [Thermodesulfovibrionales bacterium]
MEISISSLRNNKLILRQLRWDVTPEVLFKPRFAASGSDVSRETQGYMLYVEGFRGAAKLMLMRTIEMMSQTVAEVTGVPEDMLKRAMEDKDAKCVAGMYPLGRELEDWLKKELGVGQG